MSIIAVTQFRGRIQDNGFCATGRYKPRAQAVTGFHLLHSAVVADGIGSDYCRFTPRISCDPGELQGTAGDIA